MKTFAKALLLSGSLFTATCALLAGVAISPSITEINQFKTAVYSQTNSAPPVAPNAPNAYYFGAYVLVDPNQYVSNVVANPLGGNGLLALTNHDPFISNKLYNSTPYYTDEGSFDADYPGGTYDYTFDYTDLLGNLINSDIGFFISYNNLYSDAIPAFTPACWNAMQHVDPSQDFTLDWNSYGLTPGADFAATFINIFVPGGYSLPGFTGLPSEISTNIPAGTLQYGRVYEVDLYFSERQSFYSSGASIISGWDRLTAAYLTTIAPWLKIDRAGQNVIVSWPSLAAPNYQLQTTTGLSHTNLWQGILLIPNMSGGTNSLTFPATNRAAFFRLAPHMS